MSLIFSIIINALILWGIAFFLPFTGDTGVSVVGENLFLVYIVGGCILGLLNIFVKPLLKIIGFPFTVLTFGLFIFIINAIILALLQVILERLNLTGMVYEIHGVGTFVIAVVIFTVLNTLFSIIS